VGSIRIEARRGACMAAEHILALGHRHIAILATVRKLADPVWHPPGVDRRLAAPYPVDLEKLEGYADALSAAGLRIEDMPMVSCHPPARSEVAASLLLDNLQGATAILAMSDRQAIAVLEEAARRGIRVPEDLSVIGFDDVPGADLTRPPLTTIAQPVIEKGRLAARMLFEGKPRREMLPVNLVVRASTARPKA
jgi:DNA-binding LacI/PurR family transcriptional regulator